MMPIQVPPAINYSHPLIPVKATWMDPAPEGAVMIPIEIQWGNDGGPNNAVNINFQNNSTAPMSKIAAISVDNSLCAADLEFIFPDTSETTSIPAYAPKCIIPVFTNATQFYVYAPDAQPEDVTRFSVHNTMPPPVTVPFTVEQLTNTANNLTADGHTEYPLVGAAISGTLEGIQVNYSSPVANTGTIQIEIVDGTGKVLFVSQIDADHGTAYNYNLIQFDPIHVRFNGGINLIQSGPNVGGTFSANILYRTP